MASYQYRYDPATGEAYLVSGDAISSEPSNVQDLLNGKYTLSGTRLVDTTTGRIVGNIGAGPVNIYRYTTAEGKVGVALDSQIQRDSLNAPGPRNAVYSISGDVTVLFGSAGERSMTIDAESVTGFGQRVLTYRGEGGIKRYEAVTMGDEREAAIRELYGDTVRWATPTEASTRAIAGYISRNYMSLVRDLEREGGYVDSLGSLREGEYDIILALAEDSTRQLNFRQTYYFNTEGNFRSVYG